MDIDYTVLSDRDLFDQLEKAGLADKLTTSPEWMMLQEAGDRIVERAIREIAFNPDALKDPHKCAELRVVIKKYKYGLLEEVKMLKQESDFIYQSAKDRGLVGELWERVKGKIAPVR